MYNCTELLAVAPGRARSRLMASEQVESVQIAASKRKEDIGAAEKPREKRKRKKATRKESDEAAALRAQRASEANG